MQDKPINPFARWIELRKLDLALFRPAPPAPQLVGLNAKEAVWRITVPNQADRFMVARSSDVDRLKYVVVVDGERFYRTWLSGDVSVGRPDRCLLRADMPTDYKFDRAVTGFSRSAENPVPLANVDAFRKGQRIEVGFTNGITRTFWLLAHRARAFPLAVSGSDSAELMNQVAGTHTRPIQFEDLFRNAKQKQSEDQARGDWASLGSITDLKSRGGVSKGAGG